jgi:hypothetical protein
MYVKGVHSLAMPSEGGEAGPIEEAATGERDTPTRAYAMEGPRRPQYLETLKSPVGGGVGPYPAGPEGEDAEAFDGNETTQKHPEQYVDPVQIKLAMASSVKNTIPLGSVFRGALPAPAQPAAPVPPTAPTKPNWQASLHRALVVVGRRSEDLVRRYRTLPQNTQIIVIIVAGTTTILVLGFILFLITH